jgi:undecaprenyl diphosphate synthase
MEEKIDLNNLPRHIAVIMDGNGRWAKKKGAVRIFGHKNAIKAVHEIAETSAELGIEYLTLYAFSTENWGRPQEEVNGLMELLVSTIRKETKTLQKNNIRLSTIGFTDQLPVNCQNELKASVEETKLNDGLNLILALSYSGRSEILNAVKNLIKAIQNGEVDENELDQELFSNYLFTRTIPDPELLIRTSGEMRVSNFLLWQIAYSELFFTERLWPDFRKNDLYEAIIAFQKRERRFGKISEQLKELS